MPLQMKNFTGYKTNSIVLEGLKILGEWAKVNGGDGSLSQEYYLSTVFEVGWYETSDSTVIVIRMADEITSTMTLFCARYGKVGMTAREIIQRVVYEADTNFDVIYKDGKVTTRCEQG